MLFAVSSALAGSAVSVGELIAFRVLQGAGGGLILPVGQLIIAQASAPGRPWSRSTRSTPGRAEARR